MNSVLMEEVYQFTFQASWDDDILDVHLEGTQFWVIAAILNSMFYEYSVSRKMQELVLLGCNSHLNPLLLVMEWVEIVKPRYSVFFFCCSLCSCIKDGDLPVIWNQPLKLPDDYYIGTVKNKELRMSWIIFKKNRNFWPCDLNWLSES